MKLVAAAMLSGLFLSVLTVIAVGEPGAPEQFDKDAFLSRQKWYLSFTVRLKGKDEKNAVQKGDGYDKLKWSILREVSGVIELGQAMPGQIPAYTAAHMPTDQAALIALVSDRGRFIGWSMGAMKDSKIDTSAIMRGESKMQGNPFFLPVNYLVNDSIETSSLSFGEAHSSLTTSGLTKIKGAGIAYMSRGALLMCDLKEMKFGVNFDGARAAAGGFKGDVANVHTQRETHSLEQSLGVSEDKVFPPRTDKPDNFLPAMTETLRAELAWRKLEMHEGKIAFTVSEPFKKLPWGFDRDKLNGPALELSIDVVISPTPPSRAKLVLKPVDYDEWRPLCSDSEDTKGNDLKINWSVNDEGGDPATPIKVTRVVFSLQGTSKEPGVCMNYPVVPKTPADFDLKFASANAQRPGYTVATDGQKLTLSKGEVGDANGSITVDCFDSGATGVLVAEAELEDGRVLTATVEGTSESRLTIPDFDPGVSWIARSWRTKNAAGKNDDADDENFPAGDGQVGDGLTVWEEYRGFWVGGQWEGCDPKTKDLFIFNGIGGPAQRALEMFGDITRLRIHDQLTAVEARADRIVNFNKGSRPHLVDQHFIHVIEGGFDFATDGSGISAASCTMKSSKDVAFMGPPKNTLFVSILPSMLSDTLPKTQDRMGESYDTVNADTTICHELGHAIGIRHHGDKDTGMRSWTFSLNDHGDSIFYVDGKQVRVRNEQTGDLMDVQQLFPGLKPGEQKFAWIGERNGQHGGDEACIMRYDVAEAYRSQTEPDVIYLHFTSEITGHQLCTSPAGTGVNMPTHEPQSRYFGADTDRGDCAHKFVISDHWENIHK